MLGAQLSLRVRVLVVRGLYRLRRNPMFVGVGLMLVGMGVLFRSALVLCYAAVVLGRFHNAIVTHAEHDLRNEYGIAYEEYSRRVPRWLPVSFLGAWTEPLTGYEVGVRDTAE